jgi:exodeoxyribonuclease VII large subunit
LESLSLSKLNLYIRRVITLNFQEPLWVTAELLSIKEKNGHYYLELIEKDSENVISAQNSAVIWKTAFSSITKNAAFDPEFILAAGNEVRLFVSVDYNVRYGLKLNIQDIDPGFTLGKIAKQRLEIIDQLKREGLWQINKDSILPIAIKRIAVITSSNSAGYKDFENHLLVNPFNFGFSIQLFNVSVQGINSSSEIVSAFNRINLKENSFDLIVLIRGGGSKLDLLEFDSYEIAKAISKSTIPVLTGIGHFIDESIADLSAYKSLKTPTAVADFILALNRDYELNLVTLLDSIKYIAMQIHTLHNSKILNYYKEILLNARMHTFENKRSISEIAYQITHTAKNAMFLNYKRINEIQMVIETNDPEQILQKGYSLSYKNGILISKCEPVIEGDEIRTVYSKGVFTSNVTNRWVPKN